MAANHSVVLSNVEYKLDNSFGCASPVIYSRNVYEALDSFADVPVEILCCIIEKLTADDLESLSLVSSEWRMVAKDSSLWKRHCSELIAKHPCKCCMSGINNTMIRKAALYGWTDVYKTAKAFNNAARWGQVLGTPDEVRLKNLQFNESRTTLKNLRGRWVTVQLGNFTLSNPGIYHFTFQIDAFLCNGMMIGLVNSKWQGLYPGTGNAGVSATSKTCAYYSHSTTIFTAGDIVCMVVDLEKNTVSFHKNGVCMGTVDAPNREIGEDLMVVSSFCGTQHQISILSAYAHPPNVPVQM